MNQTIKSYEELLFFKTFDERFKYLKLDGVIGDETFGFDRYLNQTLYHSKEWMSFRDKVIIRDNGCDLGLAGYDIVGKIIIHHINPITRDDIVHRRRCVFDMNNVIATTLSTHNAIHYGDINLLTNSLSERSKHDTCPWKKGG